MSRKKSMKKKLAVAMSVVNALNAVAPMALSYVNVSQDMSTAGGGKRVIWEGFTFLFPARKAWPMRRK